MKEFKISEALRNRFERDALLGWPRVTPAPQDRGGALEASLGRHPVLVLAVASAALGLVGFVALLLDRGGEQMIEGILLLQEQTVISAFYLRSRL